jgi:hypothetical protein
MLLETEFRLVEGGLAWKPRRRDHHYARASILHQQTLRKFYECPTTLKVPTNYAQSRMVLCLPLFHERL